MNMILKDMKKISAALVFAVLAASGPALAQDTLERAIAAGSITIGIGDAPPWAALSPTGEPAGAAPELAVEVLKRMGIPEVNATIVEYGAMIPALNAGQFDLVAAGMYMKPERCAAVLFSEPDLCDSSALVVAKGNPLNLTSYAEVAAHPTARLVTCGGCVEETYARKAGIPDDRLLLVGDEQNAMQLLLTGRADAYGYPTVSSTTLVRKLDAGDKLDIVAPLVDTDVGCGGAVFRKADSSFRDAYDAVLAQMKADGSFDTIMDRNGFPTDTPKQNTRLALCEGEN